MFKTGIAFCTRWMEEDYTVFAKSNIYVSCLLFYDKLYCVIKEAFCRWPELKYIAISHLLNVIIIRVKFFLEYYGKSVHVIP